MSGIIAQNTLNNSGLVKAPEGGGAWNFISKTTASADATISITSGIDSTYKLYLLTLKNIHRSSDAAEDKLEFNLSIDGGSNYNVAKTTTLFDTHHRENDTSATIQYNTSQDLAQGTGFQTLTSGIELGEANDASVSGLMYFFDPSNTTFVKHFLIKMAFMSYYDSNPWTVNTNIAGYGNTASAVNAIQFNMSSGNNIDAGDFCLYGLTT